MCVCSFECCVHIVLSVSLIPFYRVLCSFVCAFAVIGEITRINDDSTIAETPVASQDA